MSNAEPGWYPDPSNAAMMRYYDGEMWTDHYHDPQAPAQQGAGGFATTGGGVAPSTGQLSDPGALISQGWNAVKANLGSLIGLAIGFAVAVAVLYGLFIAFIISRADNLANDSTFGNFDNLGDDIAIFIVGYLIFMVIYGLMYSIYMLMTSRIMQLHHRGHQASLGAAWSKAKTRLVPFFLTGIAIYIGIAIAMFIAALILGAIHPVLLILMIVPYFLIWVKLGFFPIAAVATNPGQSMLSASTSVSNGRFWPVLGRMIVLLLPIVGVIIVGAILIAIFGQISPILGFIVGLATMVAAFLAALVMISGLTKMYLDSGALSDI